MVVNTAERSPAIMGYSRPRVNFWVSDQADNSYYNRGDDRIVMREQHIWARFGDGWRIVAHEYGHALHERGLGGNAGGDCPSPHQFDGAYNLKCAFSEGFAGFYGAFVQGDKVSLSFASDDRIEADSAFSGWRYYLNARLERSYDGSIIERAVAAFLYDLVDGPASPNTTANTSDGVDDDPVQFPARYISELIRTCYVSYGSLPRRANGVDELVGCMENLVDPLVWNSPVYFSTRDGTPSGYSESATEPPGWSRTVIRNLWLRDLYGD